MLQRKTLGIVLITIGILMVAYTGFNYISTEKVIDLGSIQINQEKNHSVTWFPIFGAIFFLIGILIVVNKKRN